MYHMLTAFKLAEGADIGACRQALEKFDAHLREHNLVTRTGPVGRRHRHEIMDTDDGRDQDYYFIMSFDDLAHCDASVAYIQRAERPCRDIHEALWALIHDPVFTCWEDLEPE